MRGFLGPVAVRWIGPPITPMPTWTVDARCSVRLWPARAQHRKAYASRPGYLRLIGEIVRPRIGTSVA